MVTIISGDEVTKVADYTLEEVVEFIDNLTQDQLNVVEEFFDDIPRLVFEQKYTCKCETENLIRVEGIENFFD
jgi:hypothetical protein